MFIEGSKYSWRRILTALAAFIFFIDCIMNWIKSGDLPSLHLGIIISVFSFYFAKEVLSNLNKKS